MELRGDKWGQIFKNALFYGHVKHFILSPVFSFVPGMGTKQERKPLYGAFKKGTKFIFRVFLIFSGFHKAGRKFLIFVIDIFFSVCL